MQREMTGSVSWWLCCGANTATRWVVPVFVMLSGALLLQPNSEESAVQFWRKRIFRVGVPTLFWSMFYMALNIMLFHQRPYDAVLDLMHGVRFYHLHFMFIIIGLYVITPTLRSLLRTLRKQEIWLTALVLQVFIAFTIAISWLDGNRANVLTLWMPFIGYYVLGYLLKDIAANKQWKAKNISVFIFMFIWVFATTGFVFFKYGWGSRLDWFNDFCNPAMMVMSISVFLMISWHFPVLRYPVLTKSLADSTMGVYLIHPIILVALNRLGLSWNNIKEAWNLPVTVILTTFFSWGLVVILRRSRIVRNLLG